MMTIKNYRHPSNNQSLDIIYTFISKFFIIRKGLIYK